MSLSFEDAALSILRLARRPEERNILLPDAVGEVLSRDVVADRDIPPFRRSTMDGYAVRRTGDEDRGSYRVIGTVNPGDAWSGKASEGDCVKIMTGAMVPEPFDAVIPVEQSDAGPENIVRFQAAADPGQNIARKGEDAGKGDILVSRGTILRPRHISTLAAVGQWKVGVHSRPSVSVIATGGELKEPWEGVSGACIRNSNAHFLLGALKDNGYSRVEYLGVAPDTPEEIRSKIRKGLSTDILLLSGGVSAGEIDIVPQCLADCGVEKAVHKVSVQPGKPIYAGRSGNGCVVIGLPGNPVAVIVHYHMLVLPLLRKATGAKDCLPAPVWLPLAGDAKNKGNRNKFCLGKIESADGASRVAEIPSRGSGDFVSASHADGVFEIPMGTRLLPAGSPVRFFPVF